MNSVEARSREHWRFVQRQPNAPHLPILYFEENLPEGFEESGIYIGKIDFDNVKTGWNYDVVVSTAYHALLYYFSQYNEQFSRQVRADLYHNPYASEQRLAYRYFLHGSMLIPYSAEKVRKEHTIPGIGKFGRQLLREVLFDEDETHDITEHQTN